MTDKSNFSDEEWELVREGPPTAGLVASAASSGGSFRESWALAKAFTEARKQHGESELLDALVSEKPHSKRYGRARHWRSRAFSACATLSRCWNRRRLRPRSTLTGSSRSRSPNASLRLTRKRAQR